MDPAQLVRQAETISALTLQRDYLIRQGEEERYRWISEKESWDRMAEALISQRTKSGNTVGNYEVCAFVNHVNLILLSVRSSSVYVLHSRQTISLYETRFVHTTKKSTLLMELP